MDWSAIVVAVITALATIIGVGLQNRASDQKRAIADAVREQKQADQLEGVEKYLNEELKDIKKRLEEHNGYAQKFADASLALMAIQKDIEHLKEKHQHGQN